jgi:predicted ATPase
VERLQEIIAKQFPESLKPAESLLGALDSFKDIELTDDEKAEAIIWAKQRKQARLQLEEAERRAEENRRQLTGTRWSYDQTRGFMLYRSKEIFPKETPFVLDHNNNFLFDLLCYYFSEDERFLAMAEAAGVSSPSLGKGIMLAGNFGVGKTWLMKLFMKNQRQTFFMRNAKQIADEYEKDGVEAASRYESRFKNPVNDRSVLLQPFSGLCIDDIGAEDPKKHYGNSRNVIGDLIELRYSKGEVGVWLHATTNLTGDQIEQYYGGRVRSRMREIFNFFELAGNDRRK